MSALAVTKLNKAIMVLNSGSSSIKFALYTHSKIKPVLILSGKISNIGSKPTVYISDAEGNEIDSHKAYDFSERDRHERLLEWLLSWLDSHHEAYQIGAVGHRVVHGGQFFTSAVKVNDQVIKKLRSFIELAPLHQPHNLAAIESLSRVFPSLPQVACFDTAFHNTQSRLATLFAIPRVLTEHGVIRYGFHGLSYDYIASVLPNYLPDNLANGRVIVAHLGNGASMCAMHARKSVATSMGFTALDGLMMGQRCGSLDAGVVLYLLQSGQMDLEQVQNMLYRESGLLGVSGLSNNMLVLQKSDSPRAKEAIDLFCYRAACELASLVTSLQGLDAIVFTAGIGENASSVRAQICENLSWLGVQLDNRANELATSANIRGCSDGLSDRLSDGYNPGLISSAESKVKVCVIPTNEELVIAKQTQALLSIEG